MILIAMLAGVLAPGRVSHGKLVTREGSDQERFKELHGEAPDNNSHFAQKRQTRALPLESGHCVEIAGEVLVAKARLGSARRRIRKPRRHRPTTQGEDI